MKRTILFIISTVLILTLCACGGKSEGKTDTEKKTASVEKCDIDLTNLSTTVAYSQVTNFWKTPDEFMGKRIKIRGTFNVISENGRNYYSCNIGDATACCTAFLEFILKDDLKYPDEYPNKGDTVTVEGAFETYLENGTVFCQLKDATLS